MDARVSAAGSWLALRILFVGFLRVACRGRRGGQPLKTSGQDAVAGPRSSLMTSVSRSNSTAGQPRTRPGSLRWRAPPRRCTRGRGATIHAATTTIERGSTTRVDLEAGLPSTQVVKDEELSDAAWREWDSASRYPARSQVGVMPAAAPMASGAPLRATCASLADFPHQRYDGVPPPAPLNVRKGLRRDRSDLECHPSCSWSAKFSACLGSSSHFVIVLVLSACVFLESARILKIARGRGSWRVG